MPAALANCLGIFEPCIKVAKAGGAQITLYKAITSVSLLTDGGVVHAFGKADLAQGRESLRDANAEADARLRSRDAAGR